jgi:hypothetical protein
MNIWKHCRLSVKKFGGKETDYYQIHKFIDSSKLFYFNAKHRLLLHNLWGIEITIKKFGDIIVNSDTKELLVRDIAAEHCKEDLSGRVPSLQDWLQKSENKISSQIQIPTFKEQELEEFVLSPLWRSNLKSSLIITLSNFGVYLANEIIGFELAKKLHAQIDNAATVQNYLSMFEFTEKWQFTPQKYDLD